jgi:hypothetical protein
VDDDLSVAHQNQREDGVDAGHALRSSGLLRVEASQARVSQFSLKTGGGATTDDTRGKIAEVASRLSQRRMDRCDELRRTLLHLLYRFHSIRP